MAALTYDSFGLLRQAISIAGKLDRKALRDALSKVPAYDGVTGKMQSKKVPETLLKALLYCR